MAFDLPEETHNHVIDQLISKSWGELEVLEHAGHMLFPEKIYRRTKSGKFEEVPVLIRVPRLDDLSKARVQARMICKDKGLDHKLDRDLFDDWETVCTLALCIRNTTEPHEPWEPDPETLAKTYDKASLMQIWAKLDSFTQVVNPAPERISESECWALIAAIAKERNLSPFFVYGQAAQTSCAVFMADLCMTLLASRSSSESSEGSTPESSPSNNSTKS